MNIFSEIYGAYYLAVSKILSRSALTESEAMRIIKKNAFADSILFLPHKILPQQDGSDWKLLKKSDGLFLSSVGSPPANILTMLQKCWLKAKLSDPKIKLFLSDTSLQLLEKKLEGVNPLYRHEHFRYTDVFSDGDQFSDENYIKNFRSVLNAVKRHEVILIKFVSGNGNTINKKYLPLKLQYSPKNDKFRVFCFCVSGERLRSASVINVSRIKSTEGTGIIWKEPVSMDYYFKALKCREPVTVYVSDERNGIERFFMEFAPYEKHVEFDSENKSCTVKIWYDSIDETELLIRLLSFGPVIEILSPSSFREKARERVEKQYKLISQLDSVRKS